MTPAERRAVIEECINAILSVRQTQWAEARCDVHHIVPKSKGGKNTIDNGEVICPNCHRVEHQ